MNRYTATGVFFLLASVLSLSSQVGPIWKASIRQIADIGRAIESLLPFNVIDRQDIPFQPDEIGHLLLWGGGMVVLGLLRRSVKTDVIAVGLFGASVGFEFLQATITTSRSLQITDIAANGFGIVLGLCIVVFVDAIGRRPKLVDTTA
ncbi:MAG: hypothetical protein HKN26_02920 [Acidimicrobiales bacterium]|nr:hypothetical protein [Acidimicrobiales bacterium]